MKIIIFAGGTGKRFWPVSRKQAPKQFSPLISGKPLLRLRIDTLLKSYNAEDIFISTGKHYEKEVKEIAPELPVENLILEPEMRDTGPAVTLAVTYVHHRYPQDLISIQWSDHLVKDELTFVTALREAEEITASKEGVGVTFVTVPARFASPHRGYIHFGEEIKRVSKNIVFREFKEFKEKPDEKTAEKYLKDGSYGWNPGYWIVKPEYFLDKVTHSTPEIVEICDEIVQSGFSEASLQKFTKLEKISADYTFAENVQAEEAMVLWSEFGWSDVGEWIALKEALQERSDSNVVKGKVQDLESQDSIIYNLDDTKLVATIGLESMVVVNTKDVVAVFHKDDNTKLKQFLAELENKGLTEYL